MKEIPKDLQAISENLKSSKNQWEWIIVQIICEMPYGKSASYGTIAEFANKNKNLPIIPRNLAILRNKLYSKLGYDTEVPLHRVANIGDFNSNYDSEETKFVNDINREQEGSLNNNSWWSPF
ncbi:MAG: MGMT family protein [Bacteroidales bacterium]|nr:MGMT family protein [Bacteroidales bacterium]MCF8336953.1 MGMT family protein [Bacteroidales bacterium]